MLIATIELEDRPDGTFSSIPRLTVNRVLPRDSLVFDLVRGGELKEFQGLLRDGEASLRDHDELGNSLLAVSAPNDSRLLHEPGANKGFQIAVHWAQPEMCRFLLSHNASVDVHYFDEGDEESWTEPLLTVAGCRYGNEFEVEGGYPREVFECRKLLLDAGADPTDDTDDAPSGFTGACHQSTLVGLPGWEY